MFLLTLVLAGTAAAQTNFSGGARVVAVAAEDDDSAYIGRRERDEPQRGDVRFVSLDQYFEYARFGNLGPARGVDPAGLELLWSGDDALDRRFADLGIETPAGACELLEVDAVYMEWHDGFVQERFTAALKAHCANSTKVRILVPSNAFVTAEDRKALAELARAGAEVGFFKPGADNLRDHLNKTLHGKVLRVKRACDGVVSESVITGGRNVKDSFFRDEQGRVRGSRAERPGAHDSGLRYQDLDLRATDRGLAGDFKAISDYLNAEGRAGVEYRDLPDPQEEEIPTREVSACQAWAFASTPYDGDRTWEDLFVGLLAHADSEVVCVSPYFNPSERVGDALRAATGRGVRVTLFTNSEFKRDNVPRTMQGLVRHRLNEAKGMGVDVREWTDPSVQHAKTCLVDEKILYVGSANLNMRSFKHDVETGVVLRCPDLVERWKGLVLAAVREKSRTYEKKEQGAFVKFLSGVTRYFY